VGGVYADKHSESVDLKHLTVFVCGAAEHGFDVMLEIKDNDRSAYQALEDVEVLGCSSIN